jgi:mono/diheme cytochrome c family protein
MNSRLGSSAFCALTLLVAYSALVAIDRKVAAATAKANDSEIGFAGQVQPIFDANCVVCHQSAGASGGLDLEDGDSYRSIVSVKSQESALARIDAGKPEFSYLLRKMDGTHVQAGGSGEQMPPTGALPPSVIQVVRDWVKAGAVNN